MGWDSSNYSRCRSREKTTNGHGRVEDHTIDDLKKLDAGEREKIPTLIEAINAVKGKRRIFIELKEQKGVETICEAVLQSRCNNFVFVSLHTLALSSALRKIPSARRGFIYSKPIHDPVGIAREINAEMILPKWTRLTPEIIQLAHSSELAVVPWTYNTENEINTVIKMDVDGFVSDNPCLARSILASCT